MPLASRINKNEPKKKKAKVERKTSSASSTSTASNKKAAVPNGNNTTVDEEIDDSSILNGSSLNKMATTNGSTTKTNGNHSKSKTTPLLKLSGANKSSSSTSHLLNSTTMSTASGFVSINEETTEMSNLSSATTTTTNNEERTGHNLTSVSVVSTAAKGPVEPIEPIVRSARAGVVLSVGENLSNQLGLGCDVDDRKKPQMIKELPKGIIQIAAGGMHSACLSREGIVYTFGCNDEFALGRDNDEEIDSVTLPEKCIEVTAGDSHTAALSVTGCVYAWGTFRDGSGVLGLENKKIAKTPMKFKMRDQIVKISSGADHLVFLTYAGEVYTAGNSEHGQLGRVSKYNSCRGGRRGCDMILDPALVRFGKKKELHGHKQIEDVWTSPYCTFLKVKDSDLIIGFGLNNSYQLGLADAENRYQPDILYTLKFDGAKLKKAIGGMHHTLFLDTLGRVYALGSHRYGGLGLGKIDADAQTPVRIESLGSDIVDIAANTNVSYAINKAGRVFSWGTNYSKQLGQDTEEDYLTPTPLQSKQMDVRDVYAVSVGGQHALFVAGEEKPQMEAD